jgi:hypothetical protein
VADEPIGPGELDDRVLDDPRRGLDQPVAANEPLLVVVRLEVVEVAVHNRERAVVADVALDLLLDPDVAGKSREG